MADEKQAAPVLFLCSAEEMDRERLGYARALERRGVPIVTLAPDDPDGDLSFLDALPSTPGVIISPDVDEAPHSGLLDIQVPTACFHIDAYERTGRRISASMAFDYAFVFHPRFVPVWTRAGHPRAICLAHAVDPAPFAPRGEPREYDVGWVGQCDFTFYAARRRLLPVLAARFVMNEWRRPHSFAEMAAVYRQSKIVVNISRDDYSVDANLRLFEAMAAGALLMTGLPTEAEELGLRDGVHFVGYRDDRDLVERAAYYLKHGDERCRIAEAGRKAVLREHTYDRRAAQLLAAVAADRGRLFAPARQWSPARRQFFYVRSYADAHRWNRATSAFRRLAGISRWRTACALPWMAREALWQWRLRAQIRKHLANWMREAAALLRGSRRWPSR